MDRPASGPIYGKRADVRKLIRLLKHPPWETPEWKRVSRCPGCEWKAYAGGGRYFCPFSSCKKRRE